VNKRAQQQAAALERFKQKLEAMDYFEKCKRSYELWNNDREHWFEAYKAVKACKRDELIFEAVEAGATKSGIARLIGLSASGVAMVVTKVAAHRYFQMKRQKRASRKSKRKRDEPDQ
jgi:hypothetical protein